MTTEAPRRTRWSRGRVRAVAWVTGGATFLSVMGVLGVSPKPAQGTEARDARRPRTRPTVIVRRVIRRIVIVDPAAQAPVTFVSGGSSTSGGTTSGGTIAPAPPPAPPPTSGS